MALVISKLLPLETKVQIQSGKKWKEIFIVLQHPVDHITKTQPTWVLLEAYGEDRPLAGISEVQQMHFSASLKLPQTVLDSSHRF